MLVISRFTGGVFIIDKRLSIKVTEITMFENSVKICLVNLKNVREKNFFLLERYQLKKLEDNVAIKLLNIKPHWDKNGLMRYVADIGISAPKSMKIMRTELIARDKNIWENFRVRG